MFNYTFYYLFHQHDHAKTVADDWFRLTLEVEKSYNKQL